MAVEQVPPLGRVGVEALLVEGGDRVGALARVLQEGVFVVDGVGWDVVPGVEFVDFVAFFEVARAELEGVGAFQVVAWVVRAVGGLLRGVDVRGDVLDCGEVGWRGGRGGGEGEC